MKERIKLGIVANEFFHESAGDGRFGGFGWAAKQVANLFHHNPKLRVEVIFLCCEPAIENNNATREIHGTRLIPKLNSRFEYLRTVWSEKIDVLLCIDYRASYDRLFKWMPRTPIILWSRDPYTKEDVSRISTLQIPGQEYLVPMGINTHKCNSFAKHLTWSKLLRRKILLATTASYLVHKIPETYGTNSKEISILPNIIDLNPGEIHKSLKPSVIFLGRLDPIKRPWLAFELAKDFSEVDFFFCGERYQHCQGAWYPETLPDNVHMLGHIDGKEKLRLLCSAWVLINTSIHEGLAVSFQEALRCETPLLSTVDPQGIVSEFGIYAGYWEGTGLDALPHLRTGLKKLLDDKRLRKRLAIEGRKWVQKNHTAENFIKSFFSLCEKAKVPLNQMQLHTTFNCEKPKSNQI